MTLPTNFQFSQGSLQDYVDCHRRFQLRYVRRLRWPAVEAEPALENERYLLQGAAFHRLIHQHLAGIPAEQLSKTAADPELRRWWRNYLESGPAKLPSQRYPEVGLSAPVERFRLVAQYDLVAVDAGERAVIVDWKTNREHPKREWLSERLQTHVYPYLLIRAGAHLNVGKQIDPKQVKMVYWFANFPAMPECFDYNADQYRADSGYLSRLVNEIAERFEELEEDYLLPRTDVEHRCRYCRYRSLCERGVEAGLLEEATGEAVAEGAFDFKLDFEQIAEIEYG